MRNRIGFGEDDELAEANATRALNDAQAFNDHPCWIRLCEELEQEIAANLHRLEVTAEDDERCRGALKVLRYIQQYPQRVMRAAETELARHRG